MEYLPSRSQCQAYTAAPASGVQPLALSRRVSVTVSGTPSAVLVEVPKLGVMS